MSEDNQLQFLDSRVDYLDDTLRAIIDKYGSDAVEIIPNVDIKTINALTDSAGKSRRFIEFVSSDDKMEIKSKDANDVIETQTIYETTEGHDSLLATSQGSLKNLLEGSQLESLLSAKVNTFGLGGGSLESSAISKENIAQIRKYMEALSSVFGFNSPQDKEMFTAAWLSQDTTTRLSGIPGTGKTTLIECAALLFGNSYGFIGDRHDPNNQIWNPNRNSEQTREWEKRRFKENSYRYPFDFLLEQYLGRDLGIINRNSKMMFGLDAGIGGSLSNDNFPIAIEAFKKNMVLLVGSNGSLIRESGNVNDEKYSEKLGWVRWPPKDVSSGDYDFYRCVSIDDLLSKWEAGSTGKEGDEIVALYEKFGKDKLEGVMDLLTTVKSREISEREASGHLYSDYRISRPANEDDEGNTTNTGKKEVLSEMRNEIGMAKVDKDKRAEQLLYGVDITSEDAVFDGTAGLQYRFQPFPRPIVTQPIKFFNEVNRSQASVEDAILGLIAEGEVEYRGEVFQSPDYTAFMDTNPHVGGNDLAFTDRIDMELLFPSALLDQRYKILKGRLLGGNQTTDPRMRLLNMMLTNDFKPIRYEELKKIWTNTKQVSYVKEGYNALMDISIISTLFAQRFGVHEPNATIEVSAESFAISLNHDRNSGDYQNSLIPVNSSGYFIDASISESKVYRNSMEKSQQALARGHGAMALMDRVLAMRFTNSLAKLARSLAYLRGNQYVTRNEVMDCLPYVVGHRMGRSKGDGGKIESGLNAMAAAKFASGQEFVREAIVKGYIERAIDSFGSLSMGSSEGANDNEQRSQSRWVEWDSMLEQARKDLATSRTYAEYEMKMWAMGRMASGDGNPQNAAGTGDPMAYLIYKLVLMEELTTLSGSPELKEVTYGKFGDKNYTTTHTYNERINFYQEQISAFLTSVKNYSANDIGILRRRVTLERWLTMGDKISLLNQIDSLLDELTGFQIPDLFGPQDEITETNSKIWGLYSACTQQIPDEYRELGLLETTRVIGFPANDFIRNPTWYGGSGTGRASRILYAGQEGALDKDAFIGLKGASGGEATTTSDGVLTDAYAQVSYPTASKRNLEQTTSFQASIRTDDAIESVKEIVGDFLTEIPQQFEPQGWVEMLELGESRDEESQMDGFVEEIISQIQQVRDLDDGVITKDYVIELATFGDDVNFTAPVDFRTLWDSAADTLLQDDTQNTLRFYVSLRGHAKDDYIRVNFCLASMNVILDSNGDLTPVAIMDEYPLGEGMADLAATAVNKETFFDLGNITRLSARRFREIVRTKLKRLNE